MLKALKKRLKTMSEDSDDTFYAEIEKRVGADRARETVDLLRNFVLVMPEMLAQVRAWLNNPNLDSNLKNLQGFCLTYLYHPEDLLKDKAYGLFGYLDDAYMVGLTYETTMNKIDYDVKKYLPNQADITKQIPLWIKTTREVLPKETENIDKSIEGLLNGNMNLFEKIMVDHE
jgi:uncharacterized membrane protein YkvA (DUF1232 family)